MKPFSSAFATLFVMVVGAMTALATPYWTEDELAAARAEFNPTQFARNMETGIRRPNGSLDEVPYFLKYRQLCDFLAGMQYLGASNEFGGMREGEVGSDFSIIQTDNTQEAIRVWSQYAVWTGDTATYAQNIRDAWTYCEEWPAWEEEGGGYYAMHNCGWGFEAAAKYREAYQDTSWDWYADACANWVMANPLALNTTVNIAAQGLGIGGMYPHAIYRGRTDWRDHTLTRARLIRNWFEANPSRLNTATEWALCGGTAIWGVCNSLWIAYPDSGAMWIEQYGENLETFETPSSWYNAYNTWNSNATFRFWEISGDSLYWNRGVFYADSLAAFDVDDDGAIPPGTCCITNGNDHSWVSAYMGWMAFERIISSGSIVWASSQGVVVPDPARPLMELDSTPVITRIANLGVDSTIVYTQIYSPISYGADTQFVLRPGEVRDISWPDVWHLPQISQLPTDTLWMQVIVDYWGFGPGADTITEETFVTFDLRERTSVFGTISGEHDVSGVPVLIDFYCEGYPDSLWTSVLIPAGQPYTNGTRPLLAGSNRMVITTPLRYMIEERNFVTIPGNTDPFDIWLTSSDVVLVDDDNGAAYDTFIVSSLNQLAMNTRIVTGAPTEEMSLASVERMIWMTGDAATGTLMPEDRVLLADYLNSGGGLLLTGQNITDDPANEQYLADVFHCQPDRDDTDRPRAYGIGGLPPVDGQFLLLLGAHGAGNQNSPSSLIPLDGGTICFVNDTTDLEMCGVYGQYGLGKFIFLSFGLEAASGQVGSTSRAEFLDVALNSITTDSPERLPTLPGNLFLEPAYPNPFNSSVEISWTAPMGAAQLSLDVYDVLGRQVIQLFHGPSAVGTHRVSWNAKDAQGVAVASGTYYVRLKSPDAIQVRALRLVR